jgi:hypothetical protein
LCRSREFSHRTAQRTGNSPHRARERRFC